MVEKSKPGMIPGLVDPFKRQHKLLITLVVNGGV
jgi:hypothetical protein